MPKLVFVNEKGERREVEAPVGMSLLQIAHKHKIPLEGTCDHALSCATCHVVIDPAFAPKLPGPSRDEQDMLDLAFGVEPTSRLACQLKMRPEWDGLVVRLPPP